jgi:Co/Zn/Cd efflux system component
VVKCTLSLIMRKTTFTVSKMDCPSEEQMIRLKLEGLTDITSMQFDIPNRKLDIYHTDNYEPIFKALDDLQLGASFVETNAADDFSSTDTTAEERKLLRRVLGINFFFFALEMLTGFISNSMGLVADSLDMLADSLVYGLALFAVGGTIAKKKNIAKASGYFQLILAVFGFTEVIRRFLGYSEVPAFQIMIVISILALIGNTACLYLLQKSKSTEAHMQASMIFTSNDVMINVGVIIAGISVFLISSKLPDLIIGMIVFLIVGRGAYRILQISK